MASLVGMYQPRTQLHLSWINLEIELNVYRTPDNTIKNAEIIIPELKLCFDNLMTFIRECLESKEAIIENDKYNALLLILEKMENFFNKN